MTNLPQISEAEWEIVKILWDKPQITAREVMERLDKSIDWKFNTVKTLLWRLVEKKAVGFDKVKRTYYYYPLVDKQECAKVETQSFLKRVFDGSLSLMMENFLKYEKVSKKEIDELKKMLEEDEN